MSAEATAYGAVTIVNAMATGKGAAFGIDLWTKAKVRLTDDATIEVVIHGDREENTLLAEKCITAVLTRFGMQKLGVRAETESNIPIARGLKSSSVAGNAVTLATLAALEKQLQPNEILDLVVNASLEAKVSVTGAFDDAAASLYGNVVVTDNTLRKILRTYPIEDHQVLLLVPREKAYTVDVDLNRIKTFARQIEVAHELALAGKYWNAMTLNGLVYSDALRLPRDVILDSMDAGALAAGVSGKGPARAFVVTDECKTRVIDVLKRHDGEILVSKARSRPSLPGLTTKP